MEVHNAIFQSYFTYTPHYWIKPCMKSQYIWDQQHFFTTLFINHSVQARALVLPGKILAQEGVDLFFPTSIGSAFVLSTGLVAKHYAINTCMGQKVIHFCHSWPNSWHSCCVDGISQTKRELPKQWPTKRCLAHTGNWLNSHKWQVSWLIRNTGFKNGACQQHNPTIQTEREREREEYTYTYRCTCTYSNIFNIILVNDSMTAQIIHT